MSDEQLLLAALDDELQADERAALLARLQAEPALAAALQEQVAAEHLLQQHFADDDGFTDCVLAARGRDSAHFVAEVVGRRKRALRSWPWWLGSAVAAALVVLLVTLDGRPASSAWRAASNDGILIADAAGWRAYDGGPLQVGDRLQITESGGMRLHTGDGSLVQVEQAGQVRVLGNGLELLSGSLEAAVSPRADDDPFLIRARDAEVAVLGTRYHLAVDGDQAELMVDEGRVRVRHRSDQAAVLTAGEIFRWTSHGGAMRYAVRDNGTLFQHDWSTAFPRHDAVGTLDEAAGLTRAPYALTDVRGQRLGRISSGVFWRQPLGRYHPDDRLHIDARFADRGWVVLIVGMRDADGVMHNIIHTVPGVPAKQGGQRLTIPMGRFDSTESTYAVQPGDEYCMYLLLPLESCGMELRGVSIERGLHEPVAQDWD